MSIGPEPWDPAISSPTPSQAGRSTARAQANAKHLQDMAEAVSQVLQVSHGAMARWTPEKVAMELNGALMALQAFPENERTYGVVFLTRSKTNAHQYTVSINLGDLTQFPYPADQETP